MITPDELRKLSGWQTPGTETALALWRAAETIERLRAELEKYHASSEAR